MAAILDFRSERFQIIFDLQVALILPTKFRVNWQFQEKKRKINFQNGGHGGHLGFPIGTILTMFLVYKSS